MIGAVFENILNILLKKAPNLSLVVFFDIDTLLINVIFVLLV